jgi:hypothetical protein
MDVAKTNFVLSLPALYLREQSGFVSALDSLND